uniref:AT-rich interactive domain-containing protein 5B n=1 Tax=Xenopus tropicalis TaxID=8364 RepID=F6QQ73_XENTR|eukprot:XP_004915857.1 PREDICTED: AT-rich interactive domain-containing protein 5B isoform X2 [Xenopus tropicalis]
MEPNSLKWVGSACGLHGPYIFYKAFQFHLENRARILSLGDFFLVRCKADEPVCIAELQLLWEERTSRQLLSSSKLYFLPEDTPKGRNSNHGEHEVIAVSEKVIVRLEDLVKWAHSDLSKWNCGLKALPVELKELAKNGQKESLAKYRQSLLNSGLNFKDVFKEKAELGEGEDDKNVMVLSYPQYCRYRSILKRIQAKPSSVLADQFVQALGGIPVINNNTKILYCRDTFDHPTLIENESICDEFAPNLKGRPRKKKFGPQRRESVNGVKELAGICDGKTVAKVKCEVKATLPKTKTPNGNCKKILIEDKPKDGEDDGYKVEEGKAEEQSFLVALYKYMKERKTPIERIPYLGFKQINLWTMFQAAQKLGGYETITARRQWKHIYDELGGNPGSTSAATCTRRHYERLILPYERFINGEEDKPLPLTKPRKPENGPQEVDMKVKICGTKRIKNEPQKPKKEKDAKGYDMAEVPPDEEDHLEADEKNMPFGYDSEETKTSVDKSESVVSEVKYPSLSENDELEETIANQDHVTQDEDSCQDADPVDSLICVKEIDSRQTDERLQMPNETMTITKQEQIKPDYSDHLEDDAEDVQLHVFPAVQPPRHDMEEEKLPDMPDYIANCTVKMDPLGSSDLKNPLDSNLFQNALKQNPKVYLVQTLDMLNEKEAPPSMNDDSSFSYTPLLYSRGNPGIMSPLAKKKLLSQTHHSSNSESVAINRPSVIQHVQSFKQKSPEEKKTVNDHYKNSMFGKVDSYCCDFAKHQQSVLADSYALKASIQECKEKMAEKRAASNSNVPSFLAEFYSSPHLHRLYRQTEHHLHNENSAKFHSREMFRDLENVSSSHKLHYHASLHQHDKQNLCDIVDDQPTDLSLPKSLHKLATRIPGSSIAHHSVQQDAKSHNPFHTPNSKTLGVDCTPKACRVSPMTMSMPKRNMDSIHRPSKTLKPDTVRKVEGLVHPFSIGKTSTQNFGPPRSLKRNLEDLDHPVTEKKIRAVSPLSLPKEMSGKETFVGQDGESSKSVHDIHSGSMMESHKYPLSSPVFPGMYPGSLCGGLSSRIPTAYSHPLQYLKNQTVLSPLMQPLALHTFMMQRQYLTNSTNSQQLYRQIASGAPVGSSYGDLLHNSIYPLTAINPQSPFPSSQMSSVHPSTKL